MQKSIPSVTSKAFNRTIQIFLFADSRVCSISSYDSFDINREKEMIIFRSLKGTSFFDI